LLDSPSQIEILGVPVHAVTKQGLMRLLAHYLKSGKRGWFGSVNVNAINLAQNLPWFREFFAHALVSYCDGVGVRLGAWLQGKHLPERIALTDWANDICELAAQEGYSLYLLGSKDQIVSKAADMLSQVHRHLIIAGYHHGYLASGEDKVVVEAINASGADLLFVGMGMPLQERWILDHFEQLGVKIAFDVGAYLNFAAGERRWLRAPWIGALGLEWLFKFLCAPRRLWKRYLIGNPLFIYRVIRQRLSTSK
jgi:N-acetylglucosaminyldiphosphoundecaprenol N-acetyl-beta-D-mannosaminyltransferase